LAWQAVEQPKLVALYAEVGSEFIVIDPF